VAEKARLKRKDWSNSAIFEWSAAIVKVRAKLIPKAAGYVPRHKGPCVLLTRWLCLLRSVPMLSTGLVINAWRSLNYNGC
jgi:hypothetical protein